MKTYIQYTYAPYFKLNVNQRINLRQHRNSLNINHLFSTGISQYRTGDTEIERPKVNNGLYHHVGKNHSKYPN